MNAFAIKTKSIFVVAAFCLAGGYSVTSGAQTRESAPKDVVQPTGSTGATAFQPGGAAKGEVEAGSAQNGNAGMQQPAKPGFDNKPPKGVKSKCGNAGGGVDASGGENIGTASKASTACKGNAANKAKE